MKACQTKNAMSPWNVSISHARNRSCAERRGHPNDEAKYRSEEKALPFKEAIKTPDRQLPFRDQGN
jgi:hypothetical protein